MQYQSLRKSFLSIFYVMSIYVIFRHSHNWSEIKSIHDFTPEHNLKFFDLVQWERSYGMSWVRYREELVNIARKTIAYKTFRAEDILTCSNMQQGRFIEAKFVDNVPFADNDIIIPIDDDDWLYANLKLDQNVDVNFWNPQVYETVSSSNFHSWHPYHSEWCSNGYAVRYSALRQMNPQQLANVLLYHDYAAPVCFHRKLTWRYYDQPFSVYVRHPGSCSVMNNGETAAKSLPDKKGCKATWALGSIDKFGELFNRLAQEKPIKMM